MEAFASGITFKKPPPGTDPAVSGYKIFTSPANFAVLGVEQKTTFRYSLKAQPKFAIEISRYDGYDGDDPYLPSSTQWAVSLYDKDWDSRLGENSRLGVGQSASWNPHVDPFFEPVKPSASREPDAGFKDFLLHTRAIGNFLDELKADRQEPTKARNDSDKERQPADKGKEAKQVHLF